MQHKKPLLAALIICVAAAIAWLAFGRSGDRTSVRVAVNLPLSGPIASFSGEWPNGLRLGIEDGCKEYNLAPEAFGLDLQDNQGKPSQAVAIMQSHALKGFDVYASGVSQMSAAIAREIDSYSVPHFLVSYDAHLTEAGTNRVRLLPHFKIEGPVYVKYAEIRSSKRVFAFTLNNPEINAEFTEYVEPELRKRGIEFQREVYEFGHSDFNTLVAKAQASSPDLICVSGFSVHVLPIIRALRAQGSVGDGNVLCVMDFNELLLNDTPKQDLASIAFIAPPFEFPENTEKRATWSTRYRERFKVIPTFMPAYAYDTGKLLVKVYAARSKVSKEAIIAELPYEGAAGRIEVDRFGDLSTPLGILKVRSDGTVERLY